MKVKLISTTQNLLDVLFTGARTCYNTGSPIDMFEEVNNIPTDKKLKLINGCIKSNHQSILEHSQFTFAIEGVSRACYDDKTKVLTKEGWKYFKDVDIESDLFATRNKDGLVEFHKATNYISYDYNGIMHYYSKTNLDLMVTPNHNMYMRKYDVRVPQGYKLVPSEDIKVKRFYVNKVFDYVNEASSIVTIKGYEYAKHNNCGGIITKKTSDLHLSKATFLPFLAWYLSDGSTYYNKKENSYCVSISQTHCEKNIKNKTRERISELVESLGIHAFVDEKTVRFKNLTLGKFLKNLGTSSEKYIPLDIFSEFNKYYAKIFIDEYFKGDGSICEYKNGTKCGKLYTSSSVLAEQLEMLCALAGYTYKTYKKESIGAVCILGKKTQMNFPRYIINVTFNEQSRAKNREIMVCKDKDFSEKKYIGKVYCVTVPNHTLFVKRNGMPIWCGNCLAQISRHRVAVSLSVQSQRYVNLEDTFDYVTPKALQDEGDLQGYFTECMQQAYESYTELINKGVKPEDARAVLPNACCTNMVITLNLRSLIHLCNERLCTRAQLEIRQLVQLMVKEVLKENEWLKPYLQPKCESLGYCPEHKGCGRKPSYNQLVDKE